MVTSNTFSPSRVAWIFLPVSIRSQGGDNDIMGTEESVSGGDSPKNIVYSQLFPQRLVVRGVTLEEELVEIGDWPESTNVSSCNVGIRD
jgi:hypothetical protein